jgi:hypothetical protein
MTFSKVKYVSDYVIEITYTNGVKKQYDFQEWLFEICQPVFYKYRKPDLFKKVKINKEFGYLSWGQGNEEMDFLPEHIKEFEVKRNKDSHFSILLEEGRKSNLLSPARAKKELKRRGINV